VSDMIAIDFIENALWRFGPEAEAAPPGMSARVPANLQQQQESRQPSGSSAVSLEHQHPPLLEAAAAARVVLVTRAVGCWCTAVKECPAVPL